MPILSICSAVWKLPCKKINLDPLLLIPGFPIFADITESKRGMPRIEYQGHTYGRKLNHGSKEYYEETVHPQRWVCTKNDGNKKRCTASMRSKVINGYVMMQVYNPNHICKK